MHILRKNRHWISLFLLPILMVIWLSVTCQACFASEKPVAMQGHDCCPGMKSELDQDADQHQDAKVCKTNCTIHKSQQQDIHDGFSLEKTSLSLMGLSATQGSDYIARNDTRPVPLRIEPAYLPPVFETYRILLI